MHKEIWMKRYRVKLIAVVCLIVAIALLVLARLDTYGLDRRASEPFAFDANGCAWPARSGCPTTQQQRQWFWFTGMAPRIARRSRVTIHSSTRFSMPTLRLFRGINRALGIRRGIGSASR